MSQCAPPDTISPNPVQAYADHVQMSSHHENIITDVLNRTDAFLEWSTLQMKESKCVTILHNHCVQQSCSSPDVSQIWSVPETLDWA